MEEFFFQIVEVRQTFPQKRISRNTHGKTLSAREENSASRKGILLERKFQNYKRV